MDLTLPWNFKITGRWSTELRSEFFNTLNHANFDIPGHTVGNADFGVISSAEPARTVQMTLRVDFLDPSGRTVRERTGVICKQLVQGPSLRAETAHRRA